MPENNNLNIELRCEEVQNVLAKVPHVIIRMGNSLFLMLLILILIFSWLIKYPDIVVSEAVITTASPPQMIYANVSKKIEALLVTDQQKVIANTPLAILESSAEYKDVFLLKSILDTLLPNKEHVYFPLERLPILFLGEIENVYANFENHYISYQLNNQLKPYEKETLAKKSAAKELNKRLSNLLNQKSLNQSRLLIKQKDLKRSRKLFESGVISQQEFEISEMEYLQFKENLGVIENSILQTKEAISNNKGGVQAAGIAQITKQKELLKKTIQSLNRLKNAIKDWEHQYVLSSSIDGHVSYLNYWSQNQTVNQGDLVFTVIPEGSKNYVAKLKTPSQNSGKVAIGQTVNIKLLNYPDYEYGVLKGTVAKISPILNEEGFYILDVELSKNLLTSYHKEIEFKHEMLASAEIVTENLNLFQRLFRNFYDIIGR